MSKAFLDELIKQMEEDKNISKQMLTSDSYANWLVNFTKKHKSFSDDSWLYEPEKISAKDKKNLSNLYLFFSIIGNYARKNYMPFDSSEFELLINDTLLNMAVLAGQGVLFCVALSSATDGEYIKFDDVKNDAIQPHVSTVQVELNNISDAINDASKKVPKEILKSEIQEMLRKL